MMRTNTVWLLGSLVIIVWILNTGIVKGLTCLQCDSVPQPRHCLSVVNCDADEQCTGNVPHNGTTCSECCSSDLCNAQSCGEPGYPVGRGPVCYDCQYHDRRHPCRNIDICAVDEECSILGKIQFGDDILSSGCKPRHACPSVAPGQSPIIGKRSTENFRSLSQILCNECCSSDLCNLNCSIDHCYSSPCQHGSCSSNGSSFQCHCETGWTGRTCQERIDHCFSSPCVNGHCVNELHGFHCQCSNATYGNLCEKINYCATNPCLNGTCTNDINGFHCTCNLGWTGSLCQTYINHCSSSPCLHGTCTNQPNAFVCSCIPGWRGTLCDKPLSFDCLDILQHGLGYSDGVYTIRLIQSREIIQVYCDMTTDGGGWTVFQKRSNGSVEFHRNFSDYDSGFGSVHGEFWLGLKYIYAMTHNSNSILRLDLGKASGSTAYEVYQNFYLSSSPSYTLHIGAASGTAGDSQGMSYNNGHAFSTFDSGPKQNCGAREKNYGGWWYNNCNYANVNGEYITPGTRRGSYPEGSLTYFDWTGSSYLSLRTTELKIRRN